MSQQIYFNIDGWGITFIDIIKKEEKSFFAYYIHIPCKTIMLYNSICPTCQIRPAYGVIDKLFTLFAWTKPLPLEVDETNIL